jgi:predicted nucleotidyltransferase
MYDGNLFLGKPSMCDRPNSSPSTVRQVVAAHRAENPRVFGSVAHGEDTEDSDLDLLVDPHDKMSLFDVGAIIAELSELLGIRVDVATPDALPDAMRQRVLRDAVPI